MNAPSFPPPPNLTEQSLKPNLHHLMRTRIHRSLFVQLRDIAGQETNRTGEYTSVSDLVRSAIRSWIQTYEATEKLRNLRKGSKRFT